MQRKKSYAFLSLLVIGLLVFGLYGCGGNKSSSTNQQTDSNTKTSTPSTPPATSSTPTTPPTTQPPSSTTTPPTTTPPTNKTPAQETPSTTPPAATTPSEPKTSTTSPSTPAASGEIKNPDKFVYVTTAELIESLDPSFVYDSGSGMTILNMYDMLLFWDGSYPDRYVPMLATKVPAAENGLIRDEGKTYEFPLRTGVKFHYGPVKDVSGNVIPGSGELTPDDAVYSFQRALLQDRTGGPTWMYWESLFGVSSLLEYASQLAKAGGSTKAISRIDDISAELRVQICEDVKKAVTKDGGSVVFHLKEPFMPFLQIIVGYWGVILDREFMVTAINDESKGLHKKADWDGSCETWTAYYDPQIENSTIFDIANGTGPYMLERWRKNEEVVLQRNDNYWRERPAHIKTVVFQYSSEWPTRLLMFQEGDADTITVRLANRDQVQPLIDSGKVTLYQDLPTNALYFWMINQKINMENNPYVGSGKLDGDGIPSDFFSDIDVRKGFAYAIDYNTVVDKVNGGEGIRGTSNIPSTVFGFNNEQAYYTFDLKKAEEHLRKAYGGKLWEIGFKMIITHVPGSSLVKGAADLLSLYMKQINPKFNIVVQDFQANQLSRDADLGKLVFRFASWSEDYHDPHNWAFPILHSRGYYAGTMGIEPSLQAKLNDLTVQGRMSQNIEERVKIYNELQKINYDEALILPLIEVLDKIYFRSWVKGYVHNSAFPNNYYFWDYTKERATN